MNSTEDLRVKQVALELGIPFTSVTRLIRRGALKAECLGPPGTWLIRRADLDLYIASRDGQAAEGEERRKEKASRQMPSSGPGCAVESVCQHTGLVGFCGQCDGQWVVQASGITYVFDLDVDMVTVMPRDVDDEDGLPSYPQLLMLSEDLGLMNVSVRDSWGEDQVISGWISYIVRI